MNEGKLPNKAPRTPPAIFVVREAALHASIGPAYGLFTGSVPEEFGKAMVAAGKWRDYEVIPFAPNEEQDKLFKELKLPNH